MIDFAALQSAVKDQLEKDSNIQVTEAKGDNFEAAIAEASTLLGVPIRHLEYEIIEKKTTFLGVGQNLCRIRAWERPDIKRQKEERLAAEAENELDDVEEAELILDKDGEVFVQARYDGLYLKVTYPIGEGKRATVDEAIRKIERRNPTSINNSIVEHTVKKADGEYYMVGEYKHNMLSDSTVVVEVADQEMKAFIRVTPPLPGGADIRYEDYISALNNAQVTYGIDESFLIHFADEPEYNQMVCAAYGKKAIDGMNAYIEYYFETDQSKVRLKESVDGKVNFKELNIIQNVFEGDKLAKAIPASQGEMGFTVTGRALETKDGKDFPVTLGKNVHFGEDGVTIFSDMNGQVVMANGKINVEAVYTVDGAVNLKTGNITFLGNVVVTGNVEEGFGVKASGNIEVHGTVDKAYLDAEGDIIVRQGIAGKEGVVVNSGRSVWAKFIENATVKCGNMVVVTDGIINSTVDAGKRIICEGKRAAIIGGRLRAGEEINAKSIGSPSGNTETLCEVGLDPKSKAELEELSKKRELMTAEFDEVQLDFQTLSNSKEQRGELPEEKEEYFKEVVEKRKLLSKELKETNDRIEEINTYLKGLTIAGRVSASVKVYSGVVVSIRDIKENIRSEYKAVTFVMENGLVRAGKYVEAKANTDSDDR
ncbi:MAG: FapA family protein [Termitinemataceae bacterium]|nr:MAG: FapA family protein [Termitinemataceae bacterium]